MPRVGRSLGARWSPLTLHSLFLAINCAPLVTSGDMAMDSMQRGSQHWRRWEQTCAPGLLASSQTSLTQHSQCIPLSFRPENEPSESTNWTRSIGQFRRIALQIWRRGAGGREGCLQFAARVPALLAAPTSELFQVSGESTRRNAEAFFCYKSLRPGTACSNFKLQLLLLVY